MRVFILEDEDLTGQRLQRFVRDYNPDVVIAGWAKRIQDAVSWLSYNEEPDLILSDIELLDGNAFQLFETHPLKCPIIFATAYDQYLLKAFQANGIAYLLKPYSYEQFQEAMQKYERLTMQSAPLLSSKVVEELKQALQPAFRQFRQRFTVKKPKGIVLLQAADVSYFTAEDKLVFAFTGAGVRHTLSQTLSELERTLDPAAFFRLNRSQIIQLPHVLRLESFGKDRLAVHMRGGEKALVSSASRTPELRRWLEG
ncbi:MAG: response regulator transcription factor [Phaeodactylibacter sp.]|nr:response regulator transcription factor [Phaeodactylibacter sp.]